MSDIVSGGVRFYAGLAPLMVDIDSVQQHPENYNNGDLDEVSKSILTNGMYRPLYVQAETNYIIAGNHTWEACKDLGAEQVPVVRLDCDTEQAYRIMIADNRIASLARPDPALLTTLLMKVGAGQWGLEGTGYTTHDLDVIQHLAEIPVENDEFGQWPTITVQVPPHIKKAYLKLTREADTDRDRFELMLRLAGWENR